MSTTCGGRKYLGLLAHPIAAAPPPSAASAPPPSAASAPPPSAATPVTSSPADTPALAIAVPHGRHVDDSERAAAARDPSTGRAVAPLSRYSCIC